MIESERATLRTAERLARLSQRLDVPVVFKASFDKANRQSYASYRGPGLGAGLEILRAVREQFGEQLLLTTDIHEGAQADAVGDVVEKNPGVAPEYLIPNVPEVQVIGNAKDERGELRAMFSRAPPLPTDDVTGEPTLRYDPDARSPVWHTDQAFRDPPPFASLLYCKKSPPIGAGGDTAFADMTAACNALDPNRRATLRKLRAVCSYAHHNAKVNKRTPTYPLLTPAQRLLHPPVYQNIIRVDESTNAESLYGFSSAVCAVVDEDAAVSTADLDRYDLDGEEDASVRALMYENLLPFATGPEFTYRHKWSDGDLVIWDNLRTIHTATPFEERYEREMWRTTVAHEAGGEAYLGASIG